MTDNKENEKLYAALKLIENLYKQGRISDLVFTNIMKEYENRIDLSDFWCYNHT